MCPQPRSKLFARLRILPTILCSVTPFQVLVIELYFVRKHPFAAFESESCFTTELNKVSGGISLCNLLEFRFRRTNQNLTTKRNCIHFSCLWLYAHHEACPILLSIESPLAQKLAIAPTDSDKPLITS